MESDAENTGNAGKPNQPSLTPLDVNDYVEWKASKGEYLITACLFVTSILVALDATILVTALPVIAKTLKGDATITFWAGTSYLLTSSVFQPFIGALSDIFGRKELLFMSLLLFTIGTIICCVAQNFVTLVAGRSVQGIGGGGVIVMQFVIFTDIIPLRQRPKFTAINQSAWAIGTIIGPLVGGLFVQHATWRWIFYLNFPFCAISLLMTPLVVTIQRPRRSWADMFSRVDWTGALLFIGSITSFLIAITWGGIQFAWGGYQTLVPMLLGIVGCIATVFWERYGARVPFVRLALFKSGSAYGAYLCAIVQGILLFSESYYLAFYFQSVKGLSPTKTGVSLLPMSLGLLPASVMVGILMSKLGHFRWGVWSGWLLTILATGLLCLLNVNTSTVAYIFILFAVGLGHGLSLSSLQFAIQCISTQKDVAYASAFYAFMRNLGYCFGVAIGGTVFQNFLARYLGHRGLPKSIANNAEGFLDILRSLPEGQYRDDIVQAYADAFRIVFAILTGCSVIGGLGSLAIKSHSMNRKLESDHLMVRGTKKADDPESGQEKELSFGSRAERVDGSVPTNMGA